MINGTDCPSFSELTLQEGEHNHAFYTIMFSYGMAQDWIHSMCLGPKQLGCIGMDLSYSWLKVEFKKENLRCYRFWGICFLHANPTTMSILFFIFLFTMGKGLSPLTLLWQYLQSSSIIYSMCNIFRFQAIDVHKVNSWKTNNYVWIHQSKEWWMSTTTKIITITGMLKQVCFTDVDHLQLLPQYLESPKYLQNLVCPVVQGTIYTCS